MKFRNISFWGLCKISLILDFVIPILLTPFFVVLYFVAPEKFDIDWDTKFDFYGISFDITSGDLSISATIILAILIGFIGLLVQYGILYFLAKITPLGSVKIGKL